MVLYDEENYPGEVVKIVSGEIKVRVILKGCRTPLGLRAEIKLEEACLKFCPIHDTLTQDVYYHVYSVS